MKDSTLVHPPRLLSHPHFSDRHGLRDLPARRAWHLALAALVAGSLALALGATETSHGSATSELSERQRRAAFEFARGKLLAEEGAFEEALEAYDLALELDGSDAYSRIEVAKFHAHLSQISRSAAKRLEYLQAAAGYAGEARRLEPENLEILRSYAQVHLRLGEHQLTALEQAQEAYEELRAQTEGDLRVLTSLGQIYLWKQRWDRAIEVLEEAASYRPGNRMIQTMLLEALLKVERLADAESVLAQLIEIEPRSLEYRLRLAELQSGRDAHRAAAATLSAASSEQLENPRLRQFLAQELHLSGANEEALSTLDALPAEDPSSPATRRLRVAILSSLTRYEEAIDALESVVASEQDADRRFQDTMLLSRLLERVGRPEDAARLLEQPLEGADVTRRLQVELARVGVLERQGETERAVELLHRETAAAGEHLPMLSRALAELLGRLERTADGLTVLDDAIARLEAGGRSEEAEGLALRRLALLAAAEDWPGLARQAPALFEAVSRDVRSAAEMLYAEALANQDRLDDALEVLSAEASEIDSRRQLVRKAQLLHEHGRVEEAGQLLSQVVESGDAEDLFLAAQVYQRLQRYAEAVPLLERLVDQQEEPLQALFLLGAARERLGDHIQAVAVFRRLLEASPDHAPTLNYLGYMWADLGENLPEAVTLIQRAVSLDPDNGAYVDSLGWAYFQLGRYEEARGHLEWAARLVPDDATILEHLGDLYAALKDVERARASYQQALALGDDDLDDADALRRKLQTLDEKDL